MCVVRQTVTENADCVLLGHDVEDFNKTVAYTNQDGRIKLFRVTSREFAASSIWENPMLPRDSQTVAGTKEAAEERLLDTGSEAGNLSGAGVSATQRTDPIKLKREVFRRRRKEQRIQELLHMDKEVELQMRTVATNSSRNFDNKVKVSCNIWRQEFHHTNTDSTLKLMKDQIIMAKVYATIARSQNEPHEVHKGKQSSYWGCTYGQRTGFKRFRESKSNGACVVFS